VGTTPLRRDKLASGKVTLELRKQGFEKLTRTIELAPAQVFQLDIDLTNRRVEERSTPIAAATAAATVERTDERDDEASARRASRPDSSGRWEPRRRRSDDNDQARSPEPTTALAAPRDDTAKGAAGTTQGASAGATATAEIGAAPSEQPAGSAGERAQPPTASSTTSKPASGTRPATPPASAQPRAPSRGAVAVDQVTPRFPARAHRAGVTSGSVTLEYTVDNAGAVRNPRVVSANPAGVFDDAAMRAIEKWRYQPKLDAGRPVESRLRFTFRFAE